MKDRQRLISEMFARASEYGLAEGSFFPSRTLGATLFADLSAIVTQLNIHTAKQASGASSAEQGTTTRSEAREALLEDPEAMSRASRAMAEDLPGLEDKFRLPRGRVNDQELLAIARAYATDAPPYKQAFLEYGMPADFLEDLDADIAAFQTATDAQVAGRRQRITAAAIGDLIERGMKIIRRLDAIVRNTFRNDPAKLAAWESARHIQCLPRRPKDIPPPPPQP